MSIFAVSAITVTLVAGGPLIATHNLHSNPSLVQSKETVQSVAYPKQAVKQKKVRQQKRRVKHTRQRIKQKRVVRRQDHIARLRF